MGTISTIIDAVKSVPRNVGNIVKGFTNYENKLDQAYKAKQKSKILNKPSSMKQQNRQKLKNMGFSPNKSTAKTTLMKSQKPSEFNPANKGAFAKPKAEPALKEKIVAQKLSNDYGFSPHHKEKIKL